MDKIQTFLPYLSFRASAKCLDRQRLGKQRVEAMQIYKTLKNGGGWQHHPAVKMWAGYEYSLAAYFNIVCEEWMSRGYINNMPLFTDAKFENPKWLNPQFCKAHRSNLLRKNLEWYSQFNWQVPFDLPYIWPV